MGTSSLILALSALWTGWPILGSGSLGGRVYHSRTRIFVTKDIPRDRYGEAYQRQLRMCCKKVFDAVLHLSIVPQGSAHGSS